MKKYLQKVIVLSLFFTMILCRSVYAYEEVLDEENFDEKDLLEISEIVEASNMNLVEPVIQSKVALIFDRKYKRVLFEKNEDIKVPNASTTKILTAIVAYENSKMEDIVVVGKRAASIGGSRIGLKSGDKIKMDCLMKGLLISSGNDAAIAIAEYVGGSVETFCKMMNQKAVELGALDTNFVTPHGLDNDEHYTTALDLAKFADYLMDIEYLRNIVNMRNAEIKISDRTKSLRTTNEVLSIYQEANGLKTGFTNKAGRCLVTSIKRNDRELITIVLGADTKKQRTKDSISLINYGYSAFEEVDLYEKMEKEFEIIVEKSLNRRYRISFDGSKTYVLKKGEYDKIEYKYNFIKKHVAPLLPGTKVGEIDILLDGDVISSIELFSNYPIEKKGIKEYFLELIQEKMQYVEVK